MIATLLPYLFLLGQWGMGPGPGLSRWATTPLSVTATGSNSQSTAVSSITSSAVSVTTGDVVVVVCGSGGDSGGYTLTPSAGGTFSTYGNQGIGAGNSSMQVFYTANATGGTNTYQCSQSSAKTFSSVTVMVYHPASAMAYDLTCTTACGSSMNSVATWTSNAFSTTGRGIIIACGYAGYTITGAVGNIGAATPSLLIAPSPYTNPVCEGVTSIGAISSITASTNGGALGNWAGFVLAFK